MAPTPPADRTSPRSTSRTVEGPAKAPCGSCPYRRDVPSGIWDVAEYAKLVRYDAQTWAQPRGLFRCHRSDNRACAGWIGCHGADRLLALRLAPAWETTSPAAIAAALAYISPVPLFESGQAAAAHGLAEIAAPSPQARRKISRLIPKIAARGLPDAVETLPVLDNPVDGDCLIWAPATARRLTALGYPARTIDVAGWIDPDATVMAYLHRTVLAQPAPGHPSDEVVVDLTARMFDLRLAARWIAGWDDYTTVLAEATHVARVTRMPTAASPHGSDPPRSLP